MDLKKVPRIKQPLNLTHHVHMHARILNLMHADVHPVNTHTHNEWVGGVDSDKRRVKASEIALVNDEMMEHRGDETKRKSEHLARISTPRGAQDPDGPHVWFLSPRDHRCSLQQQLTLPLRQRGSQVIASSLHMIRFRIKYARIRLGFILLSFLTGRICRSF